jgi:hypothetical protein
MVNIAQSRKFNELNQSPDRRPGWPVPSEQPRLIHFFDRPLLLATKSALERITDSSRTSRHVANVPILLQKSKVVTVRIFGETFEREMIDDSDNPSRVTEVACEFCARR